MYKIINLFENEQLINSLSKTEKTVLYYIIENIENIGELTATQLAQESYSSSTTINRFCKKFGAEGFRELKYLLQQDINTQKRQLLIPSNATEYVLNNINFDEVDNLVKVIEKCDSIFLYALGASNLSALYLQRQMLNLGIKATVITESRMLENFKDATVFILSSSGTTFRVIEFVKKNRDQHKIYAITAKNSELNELVISSFTHNISINKLDAVGREQQIHMLIMVNSIIDNFYQM